MANLNEVVYDSFYTYAGMVIADRAIVDVRDCLKPSPRVLLYNQYREKNFSNKGFIKSAALVGEALKTFYYHSDTSCYEMYCRMAAPFSLRYPLNSFHGNYGTISSGGHPAAMRYTEMRLSKLSTERLFSGLNHNAVEEWRDNFDGTDQSPKCLPSIGYYNICNGSIGLGIGISSSIPQFNLREVNKALVKLIENPECDFDEIYCPPDFALGGIITNGDEVKKAIEKGSGASCRIRSTIEYNAKNHSLFVKDLPYGVYSDLIVEQLQSILQEDENYGIVKIFDNSGSTAEIELTLDKNAIPSVMIQKLYKDTSLESHFSINMIMLDHGRFPKVFGWREACLAYIEHIRECKHRETQYDYDALMARNHILEGLLIAIAHIDEVVALIRYSKDGAEAKAKLMKNYGLDENQVKAILDLKLQRLANMEAIKVNNEYEQNKVELERLNNILTNSTELDKLLIEALEEVAKEFGDARRTKITNTIGEEEEEEEPTPAIVRVSGGKIGIVKMATGIPESNIQTTTNETLIGFAADGRMSKIKVFELGEKMITLDKAFRFKDIIAVAPLSLLKSGGTITFLTEDSFIKRTRTTEYSFPPKANATSMKLQEGDAIRAIDFREKPRLEIIDENDKSFTFYLDKITPTGKNAKGKKLLKDSKIKKVKW